VLIGRSEHMITKPTGAEPWTIFPAYPHGDPGHFRYERNFEKAPPDGALANVYRGVGFHLVAKHTTYTRQTAPGSEPRIANACPLTMIKRPWSFQLRYPGVSASSQSSEIPIGM